MSARSLSLHESKPSPSLSPDASTSLTLSPAVLCKPLSAPPASLPLTLLSFDLDIHLRILQHLLRSSLRGTPYYPPKPCPAALNLAMSCRTMRSVVASHFKSDASWLQKTPSASSNFLGAHESSSPPVSLFHWYRLCGSSLTHLSFAASLYLCDSALNRILCILNSQPPPLLSLDLSVFSANTTAEVFTNLTRFLQAVQNTLEQLVFSLSDPLYLCLRDAKFPRLRSTTVRVALEFAPLLPQLLRYFAKESSHFAGLTLHPLSFQPHPDLPARLYPAVPSLKSLEYHDASLCNVSNASPALQLAQPFALHSLILHHCSLPTHMFTAVILQPALRDLQLVNCMSAEPNSYLEALYARPMLISRLHHTHTLTLHHLVSLSQCTRLKNMSITVADSLLPDLAVHLPRFEALSELVLTIPTNPLSAELQGSLLSGLCNAKLLRRFVLHRAKLTTSAIRQLLISRQDSLEYLVMGIHSPQKSVSKVIIRLLEVVRKHNGKLKVLCFGLGLGYDRCGVQLNKQLLESIDKTGEVVEGLDTSWLKANASKLMRLVRPADFEEYCSDESEVEE